MASEKYIIIPGTQQKVYEGTVVMLHRLPNLRWIIHNGYYTYNGRKQKGWYFSSIPSDTTMPVFNEDLIAMTIIDIGPTPGPGPVPPIPPCPPHPPGPFPPAPVPIPFTPQDKRQLSQAMLTVNDLAERDRLGSSILQDGKVVRVNDTDGQGTLEYYSWNASKSEWELASLGYRFMTREEIENAIADDIVSILWSNDEGSLILGRVGSESSKVPLTGVAHDASYNEEEMELRIQIYGGEDVILKIPPEWNLVDLKTLLDYHFEDGHTGPAIVAVISNGEEEKEIAADASNFIDTYRGGQSPTATITISQDENRVVTANVKISTRDKNRIRVDEEGLYVDTTDLEDRLDDLEVKTDIGSGEDGEIVVTRDDGMMRSSYKVGDGELKHDPGYVAREDAVFDAISWKSFE